MQLAIRLWAADFPPNGLQELWRRLRDSRGLMRSWRGRQRRRGPHSSAGASETQSHRQARFT